MSLIRQDLEIFQRALEKSQQTLSNFSAGLEDKLSQAKNEFDELLKQIEALPECGGNEMVRLRLEEKLQDWQKRIHECIKEARKLTEGRDFQNRFERSALVIVFGIVKAGKSTLGNFIRGKAFLNAQFDNPYQPGGFLDMKDRPITVEETGRGQEQRTKEWFDEASLESTVSAQLFEIPGMVWVDTPGIGAIQKKEDLMPLEELANKYVSYADLVVFLCNSANPGLREDVKGFCSLHRQGKKIVGLITRSDTSETDVVNGKVIKKLVPKDKSRRGEQEQYVRKAMVEQGIDAKDVDAISISSKIASMAIEAQNDSLWEGGNMGAFYRKLAEVIGDNTILELKQASPKKALNVAIDAIHEKLAEVSSELTSIKDKLDKEYEKLSPDGELPKTIVEDVLTNCTTRIDELLDEELKAAENSGAKTLKVSLSSLSGKLNAKALKVLNRHIGRLLEGYECEALHGELDMNKIDGGSVERMTKEQRFTYQDAEYVSRAPEGIIERVCSFFGKSYYTVSTVKKTGSTTVDLGFDISPVREKLQQEMKTLIPDFVRKELMGIRKDFFGAARERLEKLLNELEKLSSHLDALRYGK